MNSPASPLLHASWPPCPRPGRRAFTLVEMLVVVAIIGIIISFLAPALKDFGRGSSLQNAGSLVTNLVGVARQTAMSKNTMSALVLLGKQGTPDDFRALAVLEFVPEIGWQQIGQWEAFPAGIIADFDRKEDNTFIDFSPKIFPFLTTGAQANPPVKYKQEQLNTDAFAARIFMPTGSLRNPEQAAQLRLVEGFKEGDTVHYTRRKDKTNTPANWYDIAIIGATGATKIARP